MTWRWGGVRRLASRLSICIGGGGGALKRAASAFLRGRGKVAFGRR